MWQVGHIAALDCNDPNTFVVHTDINFVNGTSGWTNYPATNDISWIRPAVNFNPPSIGATQYTVKWYDSSGALVFTDAGTYSVSGTTFPDELFGFPADTYTMEITDDVGCVFTYNRTLSCNEPSPIEIWEQWTRNSDNCAGDPTPYTTPLLGLNSCIPGAPLSSPAIDIATGASVIKKLKVDAYWTTSFTVQYYEYPITTPVGPQPGFHPNCYDCCSDVMPVYGNFVLPSNAVPFGPLQGPFDATNSNWFAGQWVDDTAGTIGDIGGLSNASCSGKKYAYVITDNNGLTATSCIDVKLIPHVNRPNNDGHVAMNDDYNIPMGSGWAWADWPSTPQNNFASPISAITGGSNAGVHPYFFVHAPHAQFTVTGATGPNCDNGQIEVSNVTLSPCATSYDISIKFVPATASNLVAPCTVHPCWYGPSYTGILGSSTTPVVFSNLQSNTIMNVLYPSHPTAWCQSSASQGGCGTYQINIIDNLGNRASYSQITFNAINSVNNPCP